MQDICATRGDLERGRAFFPPPPPPPWSWGVSQLAGDCCGWTARGAGVAAAGWSERRPAQRDLRLTWKRFLARHGGKIEFHGHPTTTLEDLFLRIVTAQSKGPPRRRYLPRKTAQDGVKGCGLGSPIG